MKTPPPSPFRRLPRPAPCAAALALFAHPALGADASGAWSFAPALAASALAAFGLAWALGALRLKRRSRRFYDGLPVPLALIGLDGRIERLNRKFIDVIGYGPEDIPTLDDWWRLAYPDGKRRAATKARWEERLAQAAAQGRDLGPVEADVACKDGVVRVLRLKARLLDGKLSVVLLDVTEARRAEESTRRSEAAARTLYERAAEQEELYKSLLRSITDPLVLYSLSGEVVYLNPSFTRTFGYELEELRGKKIPFVPDDQRRPTAEEISRVLRGEPTHGFHTRRLTRDGQPLDISLSSSVFHDHRGEPAGIFVILRDITAERRAAADLRESEQRFRAIFDNAPVGIFRTTEEGRILELNPVLARMFGYDSPEEAARCITNTGRQLYADPACRDRIVADLATAQGLAMRHYENLFLCRDGSTFLGSMNITAIRDPEGNLLYYEGIVEDISGRRETKDFLEAVLEGSPVGLGVYDAESGRCVLANSALARLVGGTLSHVRSQNFREIRSWASSGLKEAAEAVLADGQSRSVELALFPSVDHETELSCILSRCPAGGRMHLLISVADVSERKRLERQILHTQKLESLGVLAGGIAHDFNNILMSVTGNADLALDAVDAASPAADNLRQIQTAALRASDLARQMLAYSGKAPFVVHPLDLNQAVEEIVHLMDASISKKARLSYRLTRPLPTVSGDVTQIRQVLLNLVINASEALGDKEGELRIETGVRREGPSPADPWGAEALEEGEYVYLKVSDTGCGMDRDTLARIFDPFFTTKFTGRGLGMAAVLGIVRGHRGAIRIQSRPGEGSTFTVLFPQNPSSCAPVAAPAEMPLVWRGSGTVLLADDEEMVRSIAATLLEAMGFSVVTAADGREALEIFDRRDDISLVLLDLTMPRLDGEQAFRALKARRPEARILLSSGYSDLSLTTRLFEEGLAGFIQKPYRLATLREAIRRAVEGDSVPDA